MIDAKGLHILPGVIDTQVHLREPGMEHKEDLATGTKAAVLGGVTAVFEMPNTRPNTVTQADLEDKIRRARGRVWSDIAFYVGATPDNLEELPALEQQPGCAGVKMFMGSSTGTLLVADDATVLQVLKHGRRRMAVHAEDEARLKERFALVKDGASPAMHPVWRDAETALSGHAAADRTGAGSQAARACAPCHHGRGNGLPGQAQGYRHGGDDAAASDAGGAGLL